jgi:acetyltransferase
MSTDERAAPAQFEEFETTAMLADGTALRVRPIGPEDDFLLRDIAGHMVPEDLRLRFFMPVKNLSAAILERLSHFDRAREMALVAQLEDDGTALGAARFVAEPDARRAEYAIGVRSDWHGRGLGHLLTDRLIAVARRRGLDELYGDVMHENEAMLAMCRSLGFAVEAHPDDATLYRVRKRLR